MFQKFWRIIFFLAFSPAAWAYNFKADGIYYSITSYSDKTVAVTYNDRGYSGDVTIPATVSYNGTVYSVTSIGSDAFYRCTGLTSVTIPNSVTTIGDNAFWCCTGLKSVTIGNGVTTIRRMAFYMCENLTEVTIGSNVTTIGDYAFSRTGLTSVTIPNSVTIIGKEAFSYCPDLTEITIGSGVTSIGEDVFSNCTNLEKFKGKFAVDNECCLIVNDTLIAFAPKCKLTEYSIPEGVTVVGNYVFYECEGLTSITIPESVTAIGSYAFYECKGLTSITIPNSVTTIGDYAFEDCRGLKEITIGNSVEIIGHQAFSACTSVEKFVGKFVADNGCSLIVNDTLVAFAPECKLTEYSIPEDVTVIGDYAFMSSNLKSITIPENIKVISDYAFYCCYSLKELYYNAISCTEIGQNICRFSSINTVHIGKNVKQIGDLSLFNCKELYFNADSYVGRLYSPSINIVHIGENVKEIPNDLLAECLALTTVTIPEGVTAIGDEAFLCTGLKEITIPESVTAIGDRAFRDCRGLEKFEGKFATADHRCLVVNDTLKAFAPSGLTQYTIPNHVKVIGNDAFSSCDSLTSITIPNSVTAIGNDAFSSCDSLTSITIPNSVTAIGEGAFAYCSGLTSVTIPESVTTIGERAFYNCTVLKEVYFNADSCIKIGSSAIFSNCTFLSTVHIGKNVKQIPDYAFSGCTNLRTINSLCTTPPRIYSNTFDNTTYRYATVNYPKGSLHAYKTAPYWLNFTYNYPLPEKALNPQLTGGSVGETKYHCTVSYTHDIEYPVSKLYISTGEKEYALDTALTTLPVTIIDLEPETEYSVQFVVETEYGDRLTCETSFTTDTVHLTAQPAKTTDAKATLEATVECDAETGYGFEWRRYGAPENLPPTRVEAYNIDGKIAGTLRNLTPEAYYEFRPYYRTVSGKYYYDEWVAFGTFDYGVEWDPTVSTRAGEVEGNNSTISAYVVEGSDELLSQGFEYWAESPAARSTESIATRSTASEPERIEGSGTLMSVTLTGLDYNTTYYYRAYATTAKKTTYGNTESFTTGKKPVEKDFKPSGITPTDSSEVEALKTFTLEFTEMLSLAAEAQPITLAGNDTLLTATLAAGEGNTLVVTLADTLKVAGEYTLTIPEGSFGDADFAADPAFGHCNPELVYTYTIKEPVVQDFKPTGITPTDNSEVVALKTFTLEFVETPALAAEAKPITLAGKDTLLTATLAAGEGNTLEITLADTLKVAGEYTLTIPEGSFGDALFASDPTTGHCNPALTYTYMVKEPVEQDFKPTGITPEDRSEVMALKTITLEFVETPSLAAEAKPITLAGKDTLLTATLAAGEGNTLEITLADTLKVAGEYTLTIPEGSFGDALFASDPTTGHCNPALTYTYTIKEPEPVEPDEPDEPSSITETTTDAEHIAVYNLQGVLVLETNDAADLKTLQNGAYIVNGKTMIIVR